MVLQYLKNLIKPIAPIQMGIAPLALAGLTAIPGIIKGIQGARQMKKAKGIKPDPLSAGTTEATSMARQRAMATLMPGEEQIQENLAQSTAQSIANVQKAATGTADVLAGVSGATTAQNKALRNLGIQSAQYRDQAGMDYQQQLQRQAAEEQFNRQQAQQMQEQYRAAGMQNIFSGLGDLTNVGLAAGMGMFGDIGGGAGAGAGAATANNALMNQNVQGLFQEKMARQMQQANFGQLTDPLTGLLPRKKLTT